MTAAQAPHRSPGEVLPQRCFHVDQALIARYADVSGDHNPLHLNPEFAKGTRFGRVIAHGMMTLAFVSRVLEEWAGAAWHEGGELAVTFVAPVFVDADVTVRGEVKVSDADRTTVTVTCWVEDRLVLTGEASVPAAAAHG